MIMYPKIYQRYKTCKWEIDTDYGGKNSELIDWYVPFQRLVRKIETNIYRHN